MTSRSGILVYGVFAYAGFVGAILYLVGFVGNFVVPRSIDVGPHASVGTAAAVDLILIGLFGIQHSVMARPMFKRWITRLIPRSAERSTFVLATACVFGAMYWFWRPIPSTVWQVESTAFKVFLVAVFFSGWLTALVSTFLINHSDLFGLRQVRLASRGLPYRPVGFSTRGLYRFVRHPINLGFIIAIWAAPEMTVGHLLFSIAMTLYILIATPLEERDLERMHGDSYRSYKQEVPMLLPKLPRH